MAHAATQPTPITGKNNEDEARCKASSPLRRHRRFRIVKRRFRSCPSRSTRSCAKTATSRSRSWRWPREIISLVTTDIGDGPLA